jgi:hypothetical protein
MSILMKKILLMLWKKNTIINLEWAKKKMKSIESHTQKQAFI